MAVRSNHGEIPERLQAAGKGGGRHVAMLISLAIEGPATVSELAERLGMSVAHTSLVVGELARAQLVEREHDPEDRRRIVVSISDVAKPDIAEMRRRRSAPLQRFLNELDPAEADTFIAHLSRLTTLLRDG
jgi:DNA-binding MarR family transcriptional regulator